MPDCNDVGTDISTMSLGIFNDKQFEVITKKVDQKPISYEISVTDVKGPIAVDQRIDFHCEGELYIVDSINSGTGRTSAADFTGNVIIPVLNAIHIKYQLIKTTSKDSIEQLAGQLNVDHKYTFIFLSGDTSISEFINHLPSSHSEITILPLPMGTGNAWASSLDLRDPAETFSLLLKNQLRSDDFPLYEAFFSNGYCIKFFIVLSLGFHANLLHLCEKPEYQNMGIEKFRLASSKILQNYDLNCKISIDNVLNGSFGYFALLNTTHLEPSYLPSPKSNPLESKLHCLSFDSSLTKSELQKRILKGYTNALNTDISADGTTYITLPESFSVEVHNDPIDRVNFEICCDGQLLNLLDFNDEGPYQFQIKSCTATSLKALNNL